jgi:UDP-2,4-diacetamido-2,4,6-trideoxy-beta-L-altropyranose hydrolase
MVSANETHSDTLLFRTEASRSIGTGHLMRCMALAEICREYGKQAIFVMHECPEALAGRLCMDGMELIILNDGNNTTELQTLINEQQPVGIVIDGYQFDEHYRKSLRDCGRPILTLDDGNLQHPLHANIVVNVSPLAKPADYEIIASGAHLLLGPAYVPLRAEFRHSLPYHVKDTQRILITFGGSDPLGFTLPVVEALLSELPEDVLFDVVLGGAASGNKELDHITYTNAHRITLHRNTTHMAELMRHAVLAITAAGSTLWELAYLTVPSIAVAVADNQEVMLKSPLSDWFGTVDARSKREQAVDQVITACLALLNNPSVRKKHQTMLNTIKVGAEATSICKAFDEAYQRAS